jgi:hypothetical protein
VTVSSSKPEPQPDPAFVFRVPWDDRYKFAAEILGISETQAR